METAPKVGPVGQRVAERVKQYRGSISVRELSARLTAQGRPILPSGITKIEQGVRRVDVDDLFALAESLEVVPSQLLYSSFRLEDQMAHGEVLGAVTSAVMAAEEDGLTIPEMIEHLQFLDSQPGRQMRAIWPRLRDLAFRKDEDD